jgi:TonB-dependent SusC/RagA subfamily outer membrane receptor
MKTKIIITLLLAVVTLPTAYSQKQTKKVISGIVVDDLRVPVKGASIFLDNTETMVETNKRGEFKVKVSPGVRMIIAIKPEVGIAGQEIGDQTDIRLMLDRARISEILETNPEDELVDIGYQRVPRKSLTGSVTKIDGTNPKYASYTNIYEMIKGEVPGVHVNGTSITIRGTGSLMLSSDPLFIVDGLAMDRVSDITPAEVKSIEVLKGGAASIYGSRGANGVIIIRRHSGR